MYELQTFPKEYIPIRINLIDRRFVILLGNFFEVVSVLIDVQGKKNPKIISNYSQIFFVFL